MYPRLAFFRSVALSFLTVLTSYCPTPAIAAEELFEEKVFTIHQSLSDTGRGGIFAHDLDGDGTPELLLSSEGLLGAYTIAGRTLWLRQVDIRMFDQAHHPSAVAGDFDGDGTQEVAVILLTDEIALMDGMKGELERTISNVGKPVAMAVANLMGRGDREFILQDSQTSIRAISAEDGRLIWSSTEYRGIEHSPLRQADLDGDGRDEIAGAACIDHDGHRMHEWDLGDTYESMDSMVIADVVPGGPLEVVLAEQRGANSHTVLINPDRILWRSLNPWNWEDPDKLAVGEFDPERPGLEIFNRSSGGDGTAPRGREEPFANELAPWVLDASGNLISKYYLNDHKPQWWTGHGLEEICRIDWDGDAQEEIVGKERHKDGAGAIVDPLTGVFKVIFPAQAQRIYAVDLFGDAREEVVIVDAEGLIRIFSNPAPSSGLAKPSPWELQHYRRQKQNWNYYSP